MVACSRKDAGRPASSVRLRLLPYLLVCVLLVSGAFCRFDEHAHVRAFIEVCRTHLADLALSTVRFGHVSETDGSKFTLQSVSREPVSVPAGILGLPLVSYLLGVLVEKRLRR